MSMYTVSKKVDTSTSKLISEYLKTHKVITVKAYKKTRPFHGFTNGQVKALTYRGTKY